ncbi:MAG: bifunctional 2-C-methyl-D-erythritol 4-phosphate cytidylyltransferase/2-C-methyl-D-erythritol 2,4-cyclodiphosphate synthase [Hyphomicrobiales bacterium]|nr:bifunctional 2-C-methyl-D-erythritol 4-phosphate cytidylyltransferase/2-C-methyl-D-erythritol 2,4-cyclodiphosphate synthase [Hyphomicrobiales bacterium]
MSTATAPPPDTQALIVAAGRGSRAGDGLPKQYRQLNDKPVLVHTLEAFLRIGRISAVQVVIHPDDRELYDNALGMLPSSLRARIRQPAFGGATRAITVRNGLEALAPAQDGAAVVLIHDAARPFVDEALIDRAIAAGRDAGAAIPVLPVTDTVKRIDAAGVVVSTLDRDQLRVVQTPQAFLLARILSAHRRAAEARRDDFTDDGAIIEWVGEQLSTFPGSAGNIKLTTAGDFMTAEARLAAARPMLTRVATGYDVHAFGPGDHVWLCGFKVAHDRGVVAHSDGDVALHALCDALFGVIGDGDIGTHFPPSDPQWRGAASDRFLAFACGRLAARGGIIDHLDVSIVCERPKIGPHREAMQARIAAIAGIRSDQVGLKATTSERLGFTGRSEGLAALATVTVRLPEPDRA